MATASNAVGWSWRTAKYVLLVLIGIVLAVVIVMLYLIKQKKRAEDLQRQLTVAKAEADIQYLRGKAKKLDDDRVEVKEQRVVLETEIKGLEKKQQEAELLIEGMTNEDVAAELANRGY